MALLDNGLKQRMVGALVLIALAVIFLPMLLSREDTVDPLQVEVPTAPVSPGLPEAEAPPVEVPVVSEPVPGDPQSAALLEPPVVEPAPATATATATASPAPATPASTAPVADGLDAASLPVSWSVQLASLSSRENAQKLQQTLRSQGYNAYIRHVEGMNRVFVGPVIERKEAERLRDLINRQQKLSGIVVRFQPERS